MPIIPPKPTTVQSATSPALHVEVFTPFTTGMNTLAKMITPSVIDMIPVTNGLAIKIFINGGVYIAFPL